MLISYLVAGTLWELATLTKGIYPPNLKFLVPESETEMNGQRDRQDANHNVASYEGRYNKAPTD